MLAGTFAGYLAVLREVGRTPARLPEVYRVHRKLKKQGPCALGEIESRILPCRTATPKEFTITWLKFLLPDIPKRIRIWRGPFRGARLVMSPRYSQRKILGLYEHENNGWLEKALRRVSRVLDVGANDGYFTFGSAAALRRHKIKGEIIAFEPQIQHVETLRASVAAEHLLDVHFEVVHASVGREVHGGMTTLDALSRADREHTLIKIDVEGAELDVIAGAQLWMNSSNLFLIEVHKEEYLDQLKQAFADHGLKLLQVNQRLLPLLGREQRDLANWWLVSDLGA